MTDKIVEVFRKLTNNMVFDQQFADAKKEDLLIPAEKAAKKISDLVKSNRKGDSLFYSVAMIYELHCMKVETFLVITSEGDERMKATVGYINDGKLLTADPTAVIKGKKGEYINIPLNTMLEHYQIALLYDIFAEETSNLIFMDQKRGGFLGEPIEMFVRE